MDKKERARIVTKASAISALAEEAIDNSADDGQATTEKKRASYVADGIAKSIFRTGNHIHAINNIVYNETNGTILVILFPVANESVDEIIGLVKQVRGVKSISDNTINDEITMTDYHVLKIVVTSEGEDETSEEDDLEPDETETGEPAPGRPNDSSPVYGPGMED